MNPEQSALSLLKSFLTKACFTVGLCTTAYWSVAKIHHAMNPSRAHSATGASASLRDKVESLNQDQNLGTVPHAVSLPVAAALNHIVREEAPVAAPAATPNSLVMQAAAEGQAAASPSPTPADGQAQALEAVNEPLPVSQPFYPNPYAYYPNGDGSSGDSVRHDSKSSGSDSTGSANSYAQMSGQLIVPRTGGGQVYGGINLANTGNSVNINSNLTSQDLQWLIGTQFKASIPAVTLNVNGHKEGGVAFTNQPIYSNRWSTTRGVKSDGATFAIRSSGSGSPLQFDIVFALEDQNSIPQPVNLSMKATDLHAKNDVRDGKTVRLYTFQMSDQSVNSNSDTLQQITVNLDFDISTGSPVLLSGSFSFNRPAVKTDASPWNPGPQPASANDILIADQVPFSMKLEKSQ